ncbi:MAG TPA: ribonuclease J, partial [Nitrospiria bacterium]|nr:ribonuclease J [Nitrospiria bacterium]
IPDMTYLKMNRDKIRGVVLTHGHEDHIGALPYLLREIQVPVYGTPLTLGLVAEKLKEYHLLSEAVLITVKPREIVKLGVFEVEFIQVTHSIVDGVGLGITTPVGRVIHTGDFKVDQTPVDGKLMDLQKFGEYGDRGTLVLMSDSTNSEREGYTLSEREVGKAFEEIFSQAPGRIIIATFASHIHRIQQAVDAAVKNGKRVIINGKSMLDNTRMAIELGYLSLPAQTVAPIEDLSHLSPDQVVIITTGSQGEPRSSLSRMATNQHKQIQVQPGDTVIFSSRVIPGNEQNIGRVIDQLFRLGAQVIYERVSEVHVSGHASQEEQKMMLNLVRPTYFIPVHGEYRHLVHHTRLAERLHIPKENIFILDDGDVVEFHPDRAAKTGRVPVGRIFIDGNRMGVVDEETLQERRRLGTHGLILVVLKVEKATGRLVQPPDLITRGFGALVILEEVAAKVHEILEEQSKSNIDAAPIQTDWAAVQDQIKKRLRRFLLKKIERNPVILPIIIEV